MTGQYLTGAALTGGIPLASTLMTGLGQAARWLRRCWYGWIGTILDSDRVRGARTLIALIYLPLLVYAIYLMIADNVHRRRTR